MAQAANHEQVVGVVGDCLDGTGRMLVYSRPSERFSWEPRKALMREPAHRALVLEYEAYLARTLPDPKEGSPPPVRARSSGNSGCDGTPGSHGTSPGRRARFSPGSCVLVRDSLEPGARSLPAIVCDVQGDTIRFHLIGWSADMDDTLIKSSGRLGDLVGPEQMGGRLHSSGLWRTLFGAGSDVEPLAPAEEGKRAGGRGAAAGAEAGASGGTGPSPKREQAAADSLGAAAAAAASPAARRGADDCFSSRAAATPCAAASTLGALDQAAGSRAAKAAAQLASAVAAKVPPAGTAARAAAGRLAAAAAPRVEMAAVDMRMGDSSYAPSERRGAHGEPVAKPSGQPSSALVEAAFRARRGGLDAFAPGCRVLSNYEPQLWYRCSLVSLCRATGKGRLLYDADGAYEDVALPDPAVILLGTPARPSAPSGPRPKLAAGPARLPPQLGDALVEAVPESSGRLWVVSGLLEDGLLMLRSRVGSSAVRHASELWLPTAEASSDWKHFVTEEQDQKVSSIAKKFGVDAPALAAANKRWIPSLTSISLLWKGTVLLLPAPSATSLSVEAALELWAAEEQELVAKSRAPHAAAGGAGSARSPAKAKGARALAEAGARAALHKGAPRGLARKREHEPAEATAGQQADGEAAAGGDAGVDRATGDVGAARPVECAAASAARAKRFKAAASAAAARHALDAAAAARAAAALAAKGGKAAEKKPRAVQADRPQGRAPGAPAAQAAAAGALGAGAGGAGDGVARILRVMLLAHADGADVGDGMVGGGGSMPLQPHCIGAVEVLANMTLGQLAGTICNDIGVEPGFRLRIGEIPIHEVQYGKQALPFAEGSVTATISYPAHMSLRALPLVPSTVLPQYAVEFRPDAMRASEREADGNGHGDAASGTRAPSPPRREQSPQAEMTAMPPPSDELAPGAGAQAEVQNSAQEGTAGHAAAALMPDAEDGRPAGEVGGDACPSPADGGVHASEATHSRAAAPQ